MSHILGVRMRKNEHRIKIGKEKILGAKGYYVFPI